jgi:hypothetical protein
MKSTAQSRTSFAVRLSLFGAMITLTYGSSPEIHGPRSGRLPFSPVMVAQVEAESPTVQEETGPTAQPGVIPDPVWLDAPNGMKIALLRVASPGPAAYRLHFADVNLIQNARIFVYGLDAAGKVTAVDGPYSVAGFVNGDPFRSLIIPGALAVVEAQSPAPGDWPFRIAGVDRILPAELDALRIANHPGL